MGDMPDFQNESKAKLRWYIENFPSPHPFFRAAMTALEKKEAEEDLRNQPAIHIHESNVANLNVGSQVGAINAQAVYTPTEFNEQLRQVLRLVDLEWALLNKPESRVTPQMICKQVDQFRASLATLYGKCPSGVDSQPLRTAIGKLDETKNHRFGPLIGSQQEADKVCELMEAALAAVGAMVLGAIARIAAPAEILSKALTAVDLLTEEAQASTDTTLREVVSELYKSLQDLKVAVIQVEDENSGLKRALAAATEKQKPEIRQVGLSNHYFVGDNGPFCQPCYDANDRLVLLTPPRQENGGIYRRCELCGKIFWEKQVENPPAFGVVSGPNSWMR